MKTTNKHKRQIPLTVAMTAQEAHAVLRALALAQANDETADRACDWIAERILRALHAED